MGIAVGIGMSIACACMHTIYVDADRHGHGSVAALIPVRHIQPTFCAWECPAHSPRSRACTRRGHADTRGTTKPDLGSSYKYFAVPLQTVAVTQTIPLTFLENLGVRPSIKYISQYSVSGCAQKLVSDGSAQVYASASKATQAASVDAVIVSSVATGQYGWDDAASVDKLICDKASSETTLLGGSEWMKFWGLFFDKSTEAAASHCETEGRYTCNSVAASSIAKVSSHLTTSYSYQVPTAVFAKRMDGSSWGGNNGYFISTAPYKVALIQDAGATMPDLSAFSAFYQSGSNEYYFPLADVAQFHLAIKNVDVIVDEGYPFHQTWANLQTQYDVTNAAATPRAFTNGDVYTLDATMNGGGTYGGSDWFESRIAEPDAILEDLIAVLHAGSSVAAAKPKNFLRDVHNGGGAMTPVTELSGSTCTTDLSATRPARSTSCATRAASLDAAGVLELPGAIAPQATLSPTPTDATGFSVCELDGYKIVTNKACGESYVLYPRGTAAPKLGAGYKYFGVPLKSIAVTQTVPLTFLENLGVRPSIKYISQYSVSGCAQKLVSDGLAQTVSNKTVAAASVEAIIVSSTTWEDDATKSKLICDKASSETTLLGGSEWMKFWGLFFDKSTEAAASHC